MYAYIRILALAPPVLFTPTKSASVTGLDMNSFEQYDADDFDVQHMLHTSRTVDNSRSITRHTPLGNQGGSSSNRVHFMSSVLRSAKTPEKLVHHAPDKQLSATAQFTKAFSTWDAAISPPEVKGDTIRVEFLPHKAGTAHPTQPTQPTQPTHPIKKLAPTPQQVNKQNPANSEKGKVQKQR